MCYGEIRLCVQNIVTILGSLVNAMGGFMCWFQEKRESSIWLLITFATQESDFETWKTTFVILKCYKMKQFLMRSNGKRSLWSRIVHNKATYLIGSSSTPIFFSLFWLLRCDLQVLLQINNASEKCTHAGFLSYNWSLGFKQQHSSRWYNQVPSIHKLRR